MSRSQDTTTEQQRQVREAPIESYHWIRPLVPHTANVGNFQNDSFLDFPPLKKVHFFQTGLFR